MMVRCFCNRLVSTFRLMIVDHDDRPDNVSFLDSRFEVRDEGSHSCLQSLRSVAITTLARNPVKGLKEPGGRDMLILVVRSVTVSHSSTWYYWERRTPRKVLPR